MTAHKWCGVESISDTNAYACTDHHPPQAMQLALESLTFDEGTYPASACGFVANTVFADAPILSSTASSAPGGSASPSADGITHHRLVLALVDGLTQEMRAEVSDAGWCGAVWCRMCGPRLSVGAARVSRQHVL